MYHVTMKFSVAENEEASYETLEEVHAAVHKRFPNAVYSNLNNHKHSDIPLDEKLTLIWRNEKKRGGRYGTGEDSCLAVGWIFRDDITELEKREMWEKFSKEHQERRFREQSARDFKRSRHSRW